MSKAELRVSSEAAPEVTKERILDITERLLAEHGVTGTSIRLITDAANVNVAAVNYHFGTKRDLVQAVINRRIAGLEAGRAAALDALDERAARENRNPTVQELAEALIAPVMKQALADDSGWPYFVRFISRLAWEPGAEEFVPPESSIRMFERIDRTLQKAVPHLTADPGRRLWRMVFMRGATQHALLIVTATRAGKLPKETPIAGPLATADIETVRRELVAFVAGGLSAG